MAKTNYRAFYFYESFLDALECIDDDHTWRVACSSILRYGLYGTEPETNDATVNMLFKIVKPNVKVAKQHYNEKVEASKGGRPPKLPHDEMVKMKEEGMTAEEVSRQVGCSERQVYNVWSKDREARQEEAEVSNTVSEMADSNTTGHDDEAMGANADAIAPVGNNAGRMQGGNGKEVDDAPGRLPSELKLIEAEHVRDMIEKEIPLQEIEVKYNIKHGTLTKGFWDSYENNQVKPLFEQLNISETEARYINDSVATLPYLFLHDEEKERNLPDGTITSHFLQYYTKYTVPAMERAQLERNVAGDVTGNNRVNEVIQEPQADDADVNDFDGDPDVIEAMATEPSWMQDEPYPWEGTDKYVRSNDYPPF